MAKYELNLPKTFDVASRGKSVTVNVEALSPEIITKLVLHGLTQKIADSAAGAQATEDTDKATIGQSLMDKTRIALENGEWGRERSSGGGVDELTKVSRQIAREEVKKAVKARDGNAKAFTELDADAQVAVLDKFIAANADVVRKEADRRIAERNKKVADVDLTQLGF